MNLTKEQIKEIIIKVHVDMRIPHDSRYPIELNLIKKEEENNRFDFDYWACGFDYRLIGKYGEEFTGLYPEYIITIDDKKGEAVAYHHYSGHVQIKLNKEGVYEFERRMGLP